MIQKVIVKLKHLEFGIVEDEDTEMNRKIEVNFLFSFSTS